MEILKVRLSTAAYRERNLFIESEQDRKSYEEKSKISNRSVSGRPGSAVSVSGGKRQTPQTPPTKASQNRRASMQEKKDTTSTSKTTPASKEPS